MLFLKNTSFFKFAGKQLLLFVFAVSASFLTKAQTPGVDSTNAYNMEAYQLCITAHYDEAMVLLNKAIAGKPNALTYYLVARVNNTEHNFYKAIDAAKKAVELDSTYQNTYAELFTSYYNTGQWQEAMKLADIALKADPNIRFEVEVARTALLTKTYSTPLLVFLLLILAAAFIYPVYKAINAGENFFIPGADFRFSEILLLAASISLCLWLFFFAISHWVWDQHPHVNAYDIGTVVRIFIFERDGAETFVLYALMFVNIGLTLVAMPLLAKVRSKKNVYIGVYAVLFLLAAYYFLRVGFWPPIADIDTSSFTLPVVITLVAVGIYALYQKSKLGAAICVVLLSAFVGLISVGPAALVDLAYILDPGLRLMHGFKFSEIYFQYDIFLSLLAMLFMKAGADLMTFSYLGQISFFLFFVGAYFFTDKLFRFKGLSVLFVIALILARFYTIWGDNPSILGATPIRLDLWLILAFVAWKKGIRHWLVGMTIGLLVLFHRNLGLLYLGAYVELLFAMYLLDVIPMVEARELSAGALVKLFVKHIRMNLVNIILVISSIALCFILFKEMFSASALLYRKLGIGMLPIDKASFFWYVTVLFSCLVALLFFYRKKLGDRYTSTGLFILFLAIANSMYFFGRSHENNVLNISGILVLVLFLILDILLSNSAEAAATGIKAAEPKPAVAPVRNAKKAARAVKEDKPSGGTAPGSFLTPVRMQLAIPVLFIFLIGFFYSQRIKSKTDAQYEHLQESQFIFPMSPMPIDTVAINQLTHHSDKVYFQNTSIDFYYYYYGNYVPRGYFSPCAAWVYKKDLFNFLQGLLDDHYYIIVDSNSFNASREYLPYLNYNRSVRQNAMIALSKENVKLLLPATAGAPLHLGIVDSISNVAIERGDVKIAGEYTLELILKPGGQQSQKAAVINNLVNFGTGLQGLTLQISDPNANVFVFGAGNGSQAIPNVSFQLEQNKWTYFVATVSKDNLKVYANGKLLGVASMNGLPFVNSRSPITIGNNSSHDGHFNGLIKEVKITDGNMPESEILATGEAMYNSLNSGAAQ